MRSLSRKSQVLALSVLLSMVASVTPGFADLTTGLRALYHFDGTGTDSSGNGFDLTATNGATYTSSNCRVPPCAILDGSNDYFTRASVNLGLHGTTQVSVAGWFYLTSVAADQRLVQKQVADAWNTVLLLVTSAGLIQFGVQNQTLNQFPLWTFPVTTGLHHIVCTYRGQNWNSTDAVCYLDNVVKTLGFTAGGYASNFTLQEVSSNLVLGVRPITLAGPFNGNMDEVSLFNRQLSAGDVSEAYATGSSTRKRLVVY